MEGGESRKRENERTGRREGRKDGREEDGKKQWPVACDQWSVGKDGRRENGKTRKRWLIV